jgi:hypothetical protein
MTSFISIHNHPLYAVSDTGRVIHKKTQYELTPLIGNKTRKKDDIIQRRTVYRYVILNGKRYGIHRLVALHFLSNPQNFPLVDHIDGDTTNNNVNNLRWVTRSQNNLNVNKYRGNFTSQYKGVYKKGRKWVCQFRRKNYGYFNTEREAAERYNHIAIAHDPVCVLNVL